jgi:hypothetical protein
VVAVEMALELRLKWDVLVSLELHFLSLALQPSTEPAVVVVDIQLLVV